MVKGIWPSELDKYEEEERKIISNLPMSIRQIVGNWSRSNKRKEQIRILSELNAVPEELIERIIFMETGEEVRKKKKVPTKKETVPAKNKIAVTGLFVECIDGILTDLEENITITKAHISELEEMIQEKKLEVKEYEQTYEQMVKLLDEIEVEDINEEDEDKSND